MTLTIPDEILRAAGVCEADLRLELAVLLFSQNKLTLGRAAQLAELPQVSFQRILGSRRIPIHYGVEDFEKDVATLKRLGML